MDSAGLRAGQVLVTDGIEPIVEGDVGPEGKSGAAVENWDCFLVHFLAGEDEGWSFWFAVEVVGVIATRVVSGATTPMPRQFRVLGDELIDENLELCWK